MHFYLFYLFILISLFIYIIILSSYSDCKCYTLRVLRTAPPVHSVTQSICYIYIIITTSCRCCKCYTRFALRASLAAIVSYRIVQHTIHMHPYRVVSYNILSSVHIRRCYGIESYHSTNKCMSYIIPQPCTRTTTEKVNPFFTSQNQAGGWVISKSFPLGVYGFKIRV
jgi:hypothetical protein